jgi:ATP-dependent Zn protease
MTADQKKLEVAYHEAGHAAMAVIYGLKIKRSSLVGTSEYRGVTSLEPFERKDTLEHAEREIRLNLAGFVGEGLFSGNRITIDPPHHPELLDSIKIVRHMLSDERFENFANGLPDFYQRNLNMIIDPNIRGYINYMLESCFEKMIPLKSAIKSVADELHRKEELSGDEVSALFDSFIRSTLRGNQIGHSTPIP